MAKKWKGNTGDKFLQFLERRLDNTVYRMAFSPTRGLSRQMVSHGHIMVNGKKVSIPSYLVLPGQVITLSTKGMEIPAVRKMLDEKTVNIPEWVERKGPVGKVVRLPERADIKDDINEQLIIEFYSR
jgi:small subunit ribosomal protein S4